ncbi:MAG TPA: phosphodiester glycosidase family protein [Solirubrobacterales bacterium]|nr:phosphodiester glycosidase family protein [Solirubrobacterales bacterium]
MRTASPSLPLAALPRPLFERRRLRLGDGAETTLHVARFDRAGFDLRVVVFDPCSTVQQWCRRTGAENAIVGGFYMRPGGPALGDLWVAGRALPSEPFDAPWHDGRACVHIGDGAETARNRNDSGPSRFRERVVRLAPRRELGAVPHGDLLHAGPMLVGDGRSLVAGGADREGFSAGARQFDSDITAGRYPRAALGLCGRQLIAAVCDGRADDEAGLTMAELAAAMIGLGASQAINLDGGGSASLVVGGSLVNTPREEHGIELPGGRPVATALHFAPRLVF